MGTTSYHFLVNRKSSGISMGLSCCLIVFASCTFSFVEGGLPLSSFNLTLEQSDKLSSGNDESVALAQDIINDALKNYVKEGNVNIVIENNDIIIDAVFDDRTLKDRCSLKLFALNPRATGTIKRSSELKFDFRAQIGAKIFGKCRKIGRDTLGIDLKTSGKAVLAVALEATDIKRSLQNYI